MVGGGSPHAERTPPTLCAAAEDGLRMQLDGPPGPAADAGPPEPLCLHSPRPRGHHGVLAEGHPDGHQVPEDVKSVSSPPGARLLVTPWFGVSLPPPRPPPSGGTRRILVTTPRCVGALVGTRDDLCRGYGEVPPLARPRPPLGIPSGPARCPCSLHPGPTWPGQHRP